MAKAFVNTMFLLLQV